MEIIGQCTVGKRSEGREAEYIVKATGDELARVAGLNYASELELRDGRELAVGQVIPVNDWWRFVTGLKTKEEEVRKTGEVLKELADLVSKAWPAVSNVVNGEEE